MSYSRFWSQKQNEFNEIGSNAQKEQSRCIPDDDSLQEIVSPAADPLRSWQQKGLFGDAKYHLEEKNTNEQSPCRISPYPANVS